MNLFAKMTLSIVGMLFTVFILFYWFNHNSMEFTKREITTSNVNKLAFFQSQVDMSVEQFSNMAFMLKQEPEAVKFQVDQSTDAWFDVITNKNALMEKVNLQSAASSWNNYVIVYSPLTGDFVASGWAPPPDFSDIDSRPTEEWTYRAGEGGLHASHFVFRSTDPSSVVVDPSQANVLVEIGLSADYLVRQLDQFKEGTNGDPFFYHPEHGFIANASADRGLLSEIAAFVPASAEQGSMNVEWNGQQYLINFVRSGLLGWSLVDYIPLDRVFQPIVAMNRYFTFASLSLVVAALLSALLLYRNVQSPIRELVHGVRRLQEGKFAIQVRPRSKGNEFEYLFAQFNQFSRQISELIENVSASKIRIKDAELRQLQSQINPHFLYNCLAFIQSNALLDNAKAVVAMTQALSHYYRYTISVRSSHALLSEELKLVRNYLEIQKMQLRRFDYEVVMPDGMLEHKVPKLILQPIVENAIVHGVEVAIGQGRIRIEGSEDEDGFRLTVENSGVHTPEQLPKMLEERKNESVDGPSGFGLYNVHQRLLHAYGPGSGLSFGLSPLGGLKATLTMKRPFRGEDAE